MLYADWLSTWLRLYIRGTVRPSTEAMYTRAVRAVPREIGEVDLTGEQVFPLLLLKLREWQITRAETVPRAAQLDRIMITRSLLMAADLGIIKVSNSDLPRMLSRLIPKNHHSAARAPVFSREQLAAYIREAEFSGGMQYPLILLCCCGLRRGEALGIRWMDWRPPVLHIRGQRIGNRHQPPKSAAGVRSLQLPPWIVAVIDQQPRGIGAAWIVDSSPSALQRAHRRIMTAAGLAGTGVTIHGLRHTFATLAAASGESMRLLQYELGHQKMALTSDLYAAHLVEASPLPCRILQSVAGF